MYTVDPKTKKKTMLNLKEIKQQLENIVQMAKGRNYAHTINIHTTNNITITEDKTKCGVAALTTQDRPQWAKVRILFFRLIIIFSNFDHYILL